MKLNTPEPKCAYCKGTGVYPRRLRVIVNGQVLPVMTTVALHCSCLCPELTALHEGLNKEAVLRDWPWDELSSLLIASADKDAAPVKLGCPFPIGFEPPSKKVPVAPESAPKKEEPTPEKPKKKRGRSKIKE